MLARLNVQVVQLRQAQASWAAVKWLQLVQSRPDDWTASRRCKHHAGNFPWLLPGPFCLIQVGSSRPHQSDGNFGTSAHILILVSPKSRKRSSSSVCNDKHSLVHVHCRTSGSARNAPLCGHNRHTSPSLLLRKNTKTQQTNVVVCRGLWLRSSGNRKNFLSNRFMRVWGPGLSP